MFRAYGAAENPEKNVFYKALAPLGLVDAIELLNLMFYKRLAPKAHIEAKI